MPEFVAGGRQYFSTKDAAERLAMAPGTLRGLLARKVLPEPDMVRVGSRRQRGFTDAWVEQAREILDSI